MAKADRFDSIAIFRRTGAETNMKFEYYDEGSWRNIHMI